MTAAMPLPELPASWQAAGDFFGYIPVILLAGGTVQLMTYQVLSKAILVT